jgi:uncharacterized protein
MMAGAGGPMEKESHVIGPVRLSERILFLDVLRGMALFGILAANMRGFFAPMDAYMHTGVLYHSRADLVTQAFIDIFVQGKFISIFSFLFGMGFAIQMSRAEARGARFMGFYPRRLLALALFGLIHGILIWAGDILLTYALAGAILLLFRNRGQKTLLYWAGGLSAFPIMGSLIFGGLYFSPLHRAWMERKPLNAEKYYKVIDIYAHGTGRQILAQNWVEWKRELPTQGFTIYAVALFLLGMWVWRAGIVQRLGEYRAMLKRVCAWCIPAGLLLGIYTGIDKAVTPGGIFSGWRWLAETIMLPGSQILAAGYIAGLALIFLNEDWRRHLLPFAAVGRTALTNYLMQSVFCTLFFCHYTTGLFGRIGPAVGLLPTVVLFAAQVVASNWWLKRYRFGPMEWVWRGMTYGRFPAMRREEVAGVMRGPIAKPGEIA